MPTDTADTDPTSCARFTDRVALVTGATAGIGLGVARRLAREGAAVVVNDEGDADSVASDVDTDRRDGVAVAETLPGDARYVPADVTDPDAVRRLVGETVDRYGRVDALVNVVGGGAHRSLVTATTDDWTETVDATVRSAWLTAKHAVGAMPEGSAVVNVSSMQAARTVPGWFPYDVANGAVDALTRSMAVELGPIGVRANAVRPGAIHPGDPSDPADPTLDSLEQDTPVDPLRRWGRPADVAAVVAFLASDDAGYVTGQTVDVAGGRGARLSGSQQADGAPTRDDLGLDPGAGVDARE